MTEHYSAGGFNPFVNPGMGWQYVLFNALLSAAAVLTWQTMISRLLSAKDAKTGQTNLHPHELFLCLPFSLAGNLGHRRAGGARPDGAQTRAARACRKRRSLYAMPFFLSQFVPVGLMGLLLAAMLAADMSSTSSYMITWGSVIYNDILAPVPQDPLVRKTRPAVESDHRHPDRRLPAVLRTLYPLKGDVYMYLTVTGTIYLASISTMLIACCYWKRANNWGATASDHCRRRHSDRMSW